MESKLRVLGDFAIESGEEFKKDELLTVVKSEDDEVTVKKGDDEKELVLTSEQVSEHTQKVLTIEQATDEILHGADLRETLMSNEIAIEDDDDDSDDADDEETETDADEE